MEVEVEVEEDVKDEIRPVFLLFYSFLIVIHDSWPFENNDIALN